MSFLLLYDLERSKTAARLKINRELSKMNATMFQHSIWKHDDIDKLKVIADFIKQNGGKVIILEEKIVYQ
jgi:2,4-dienoyl-CoA reductase-like NADH-dependent reductase (Old Yellow Enzyme family)